MMEEINENTAEITEQRLLIFTYNQRITKHRVGIATDACNDNDDDDDDDDDDQCWA